MTRTIVTVIRKQIINLSSLNSTVYLIQLKAEGKNVTKKAGKAVN